MSMITPEHKKIAIVGNAGSGKTTFGFYLHKKLALPLYHLDQYYWKPGWERSDFETFSKIHEELCEKDTWILEGSYYKLLNQRILHADVVIFLDMPRFLCIWRVIKRSFMHWGKVVPGNPEKCKQAIFSFKFLEFLKWVWTFNDRYRQMMLDVLRNDTIMQSKQVYVFRSVKEIDDFIKQLESV